MATWALRGKDAAVDLGTARTRVWIRGRVMVLDEPSVVAVAPRTNQVVAVGDDARQMLGRTPDSIVALRPLEAGVIADFAASERMLRYFLAQSQGASTLIRPRLILTVPTGLTAVEQRAVRDVGYAAGARVVYLIEQPMAAAIGAGLPVHAAHGSMVVDVGAGTTEIAVVSLGGVVASASIRGAGDQMDAAIIDHLRQEYSVLIGSVSAEDLRTSLGAAFPGDDSPIAEVSGRDLITGMPRTVVVTADEVRRALDVTIGQIVDAVRDVLQRIAPELSGDIGEAGIHLTGGGALLRGMPQRLRTETGMDVLVAERPGACVIEGLGRCVEEFSALRPVLLVEQRY